MAKPAKPRGRPRAFDPDDALVRAMAAFWQAGFSGTSMDDLSAAMGMNRPSIYGAFGDKQALYLQALARYRAASHATLVATLDPERPLREVLATVYRKALAVYLAGQRGCFVIGTAATEAVTNPAVRAELAASLRELDAIFAARIRIARDRGELPADADPAALGQLATSALHGLAIRARAGETRAALAKTAAAMVDVICGPRRRATDART